MRFDTRRGEYLLAIYAGLVSVGGELFWLFLV